MRYLTFSEPQKSEYPIVFLVPELNKSEIVKHYLTPQGIPLGDAIAIPIYKPNKKTKVPILREYFESEVLPFLDQVKCKYLVICDSDYFKAITKSAKVDATIGYINQYNQYNILYCPSFKSIFYDPDKVKAKIELSLKSMVNHITGKYTEPGKNIIQYSAYPRSVMEIKWWLEKLVLMDKPLAADIEGFSLKHYDAGIGTIAFAWSKHEGIAFPIDFTNQSTEIRNLLKEFFISFKNKLIWHQINYDVYVLIYQLFMEDIEDTAGLLNGMNILLGNWDDTRLISYLATNSCAGNNLKLKHLAQEFAGDYAQEDIEDINLIPLDELLEYNLVDTLATWYVYEKYQPIMVKDNQEEIYNNIFKPAMLDIIQMQLTGMPLDMDEVKKTKEILLNDLNKAKATIQSKQIVQQFSYTLKEKWVIDKNNKLKKKRVTLADAPDFEFNPNSDPQLQSLLFEVIGLPVLDRTATKAPATGGDTLKKLINHTTQQDVIDLLNALMNFKVVDKLITSFIPAFEKARRSKNGQYYLFGYFNLGGTVSGRLSSSNPNLQNIPANNPKYAKLIKKCFKTKKGWLFVGLDFSSLEDRISALTTKDPNKLKVYTDGFDGHSLRAFGYFKEQMPDIEDTVESINSIEKKYKSLRTESKAPTFALTYQGTYITLMNNCGFSEEKAKMIEKRYHEMYVISDQWVENKLKQATKDGYITCAFGLRVRTPLLHQVIRGTKATPYEADAEGRTAGNALGQSWCLLNSRAASEFMGKVRKSKYRLDIRPCAQIHDAQYYIIRDDINILLWLNEHLVKAVKWQDHPDIYHDDVKIGGELDLFYPSWAEQLTIPNEASASKIQELLKEHLEKHNLSCP